MSANITHHNPISPGNFLEEIIQQPHGFGVHTIKLDGENNSLPPLAVVAP